MLSFTQTICKPLSRVDHYDAALPASTTDWFGGLEAAHEGVRFSVRPTMSSESIASLTGREKRQQEFQVGRRCASELLAEHGIFQQVEVNQDRSPAWPAGKVGSISHSDSWTIASVASAQVARSLGVDTEPFVQPETVELIADDVATADQMELLKAVGFDDVSALTLIFSAKETFFKCWYPITKQFLEFSDVALASATDSDLTLLMSGESSSEEFGLTVQYHLSDNDVFTFAALEGQQ